MTARLGYEFLAVPGPTPVPDRVLNAMHRQAVDLSNPDFLAVCERVFEGIKPIFRTTGQVFFYAANGHGAWEAAIANTINPGETVLIPEIGVFSEAWRSMCHAMGFKTETVPNDWRHAVDPNAVEDALRADKEGRIKAVLMIHTDTSAGITNDIPAVRKAMDAVGHPAMLMVDTIASLGASEFDMDGWGVDVAVAASQKALMLPPGLAFVAANERTIEYARSVTTPRRYWDWVERMGVHHYQRFCGTAPEHLVFGMEESLKMISEEGLESAIARHRRLAATVRAAVDVWCAAGALEFNAVRPKERADSVTTILFPEGRDPAAFSTLAREFNVHLGRGIGPFEGKAFRIGHMGNINEAMILGILGATEVTLRRFGIAVGDGAMEAAIRVLGENLPCVDKVAAE